MQEHAGNSYTGLDSLLAAAGAATGAAEAHGLFAGMICASGRPVQGAWLPYVLDDASPETPAARECLQQLELLQAEIFTRLNDGLLGFMLMLPDDSTMLVERTRQLGRWTAGFLYGLALGGIREDTTLPGSTGEVVRDFYEISNADFLHASPGDEDEKAFVEIVEYVRMSVLLLYTELQTRPAPGRIH